jgi:beta-mannosidase
VAVFEGLDTVAVVRVNGKVVGTSNNMFRRYAFDISGVVHLGSNDIVVSFESAGTTLQSRNQSITSKQLY